MKMTKLLLVACLVITGCNWSDAPSISTGNNDTTVSTETTTTTSTDTVTTISTDTGSTSTVPATSSGTSSGVSSGQTSNSVDTSAILQGKTPAGSRYVTNFDSINDSAFTSSYNGWYYGKTPSSGNVKGIAFLVDFSDATSSSSATSKENIIKGLNGASNETGWESLNSFYKKTSGNKLNLTVDVFGWYRSTNNSTYYRTDDSSSTKTMGLIKEVLMAYNSTINYKDYDSDNDGCIDAIYIIYSKNYSSGTNLWAYQYYYFNNDVMDSVSPYAYVFMSAAFFSPTVTKSGLSGVDSETVIHESGHLLGIEDYYDYEENVPSGANVNGGLGGADMMDYNIGDHGPFSKMLLDWVDPIVVDHTQTEMTFTIEPANVSNDVIMIAKSTPTSMFSEYILIDYYRPEGLHARNSKYFANPGIRMYHIDSTLTNYTYDRVTYRVFEYDNSETSKKLIEYVENGGTNRIGSQSADAKDSMLYHQGDTFGSTGNWATFPWNRSSNSSFTFQMQVQSLTASNATIKITLGNK